MNLIVTKLIDFFLNLKEGWVCHHILFLLILSLLQDEVQLKVDLGKTEQSDPELKRKTQYRKKRKVRKKMLIEKKLYNYENHKAKLGKSEAKLEKQISDNKRLKSELHEKDRIITHYQEKVLPFVKIYFDHQS